MYIRDTVEYRIIEENLDTIRGIFRKHKILYATVAFSSDEKDIVEMFVVEHPYKPDDFEMFDVVEEIWEVIGKEVWVVEFMDLPVHTLLKYSKRNEVLLNDRPLR